MVKCFLFFLALMFCSIIQAQTFTVSPNPTYVEADLDTDLDPGNIVAHANITNNTSDTLFMKWERIVIDKPECWETAVWDNNLHYFPWISSREFLLTPNIINDVLSVYAYSGGDPSSENPTSGEAEVVLKISNLNDPLDTLLVEYHFTVTGDVNCVTSISDIEKKSLKIYPNPTTDFFQLTETQEIQQLIIYNILGLQIKQFDVTFNQNYNISDLPNGVYLAKMVGRKQEIVKTVKLQKL